MDSASIGPAFSSTVHDPRVMWAAQKAGVDLGVRNPRIFDEAVDIVNYDLVLTMDHFDHEEVTTHARVILHVRRVWTSQVSRHIVLSCASFVDMCKHSSHAPDHMSNLRSIALGQQTRA